jgi:environmental stress-induced protein Ves
MEITIIKSEQHKSIKWSGGTSTELFIFPEGSYYKKRDFDFRLSTATVEVEKSDFTPLPGFSRKLMILDGSIKINHENHYSKQLNKFDVDEFEGHWNTFSVGKCIDFNLMTKPETKGNISSKSEEKGKEIIFDLSKVLNYLFIYVSSGKVKTKLSNEPLKKGDVLVIKNFDSNILKFKNLENSELIFTEIF